MQRLEVSGVKGLMFSVCCIMFRGKQFMGQQWYSKYSGTASNDKPIFAKSNVLT